MRTNHICSFEKSSATFNTLNATKSLFCFSSSQHVLFKTLCEYSLLQKANLSQKPRMSNTPQNILSQFSLSQNIVEKSVGFS